MSFPLPFTFHIALDNFLAGEPYVNAGQLAQLERAVKYAYDRGMYVLIDLHG